MKLIADRLLVQPEESQTQSEGGIYLPDQAKGKPTKGTVIQVGPGRMLQDGNRGKMQIAAGEEVMFPPYSGSVVEVKGKEMVVLREEDILLVL